MCVCGCENKYTFKYIYIYIYILLCAASNFKGRRGARNAAAQPICNCAAAQRQRPKPAENKPPDGPKPRKS